MVQIEKRNDAAVRKASKGREENIEMKKCESTTVEIRNWYRKNKKRVAFQRNKRRQEGGKN